MSLRASLKKEIAKEIVSCPKPRRVVARMFPAGALRIVERSADTLPRDSFLFSEDEDAGHEILEILSRKACIDAGVSGSPVSCFYGSPPARAHNPIVNDVQFTQKKDIPLPFYVEKRFSCSSGGSTSLKKSSCGTPYGSKPRVRIEGFLSANPGFLSANPDAHRNVLAFA